MKYIHILVLVTLLFSLTSCFEKPSDDTSGIGTNSVQEQDSEENSEEDDENSNENEDDENNENSDENRENTGNQQDENDDEQDNATVEIENNVSASGGIDEDVLEEYEKELEQLFDDILGEDDE